MTGFAREWSRRSWRLSISGVSLLTMTLALAISGPTMAQDASFCPDPPTSIQCTADLGVRCCDLSEEPGTVGNQFCANGHTCCEGGEWKCSDAAGLSTCTSIGPACERCCDPTDEPGRFGNPPCIEGATCCATGQWTCNAGNGQSTCARDGVACPLTCCDPDEQPGAGDNPPCIEGATCCSTGEWQCNEGNGTSTCAIDSFACERCCDPADAPPCIEGASCCANGEWACNNGAGQSTCNVGGQVCERCCDPFLQPGAFGNDPCFEGASCCGNGDWQCNNADGTPSCFTAGLGDVCNASCCDPREEPGANGNPPCVEGATCCDTGEWECNSASGQPTCDGGSSRSCEACCDPRNEPGSNGNPPCFEGATCCGNGEWQCNDSTGQSTCDLDGFKCDDCCDLADRPTGFECDEGASCCASGEWQCNNGAGESTCGLAGQICEPKCCDASDRPNTGDNPFCETGFSCCDDGTWRCNDPDGASVCPDNQSDECPRICGGIAGIPCEEGEFCKLDVGNCCCDFTGICTDLPQACPEIYDPVCGCDGMTYSNECFADAAGVSIAFRGECATDCVKNEDCGPERFCQFDDGVCGGGGNCEPVPDGCFSIFEPVCGCDGKTYNNACEANRFGVSVLFNRPCEDPTPVKNAGFGFFDLMFWEPKSQAVSYNIYLQRDDGEPPEDYGRCVYSDVAGPPIPFSADPQPGVLWMFQVTALFPTEGPMGETSAGTVRLPQEPCTCTLPADVGPCDAIVPRWYYNFVSDTCDMFIWGGCEGNANNFETQAACQRACRNTCDLPPAIGPCSAAIPRYYFDRVSGQCELFVWGGCGGNANNYETLAECQLACHRDICTLPAEVGPCDAVVPRWHFDSSTGQCEMFIWGGCDGNANNFETKAECEAVCPAS